MCLKATPPAVHTSPQSIRQCLVHSTPTAGSPDIYGGVSAIFELRRLQHATQPRHYSTIQTRLPMSIVHSATPCVVLPPCVVWCPASMLLRVLRTKQPRLHATKLPSYKVSLRFAAPRHSYIATPPSYVLHRPSTLLPRH